MLGSIRFNWESTSSIFLQTMAQRMIDGIRVQGNIAISVAMHCITVNLMIDWIGGVSYMSTKVNMVFLTQSEGK